MEARGLATAAETRLDPVSASTSRGHWTALDGVRGVAVLAVLLYHFGAPVGTGGYLGVDIFFVVSGCVVTASLRRSMSRGGTAVDFFLRRGARLLPNLLVFLCVVLVWNTWNDGTLLSTSNAAVLEGLTQTYNLIASRGIATRHLWSLSMEWQFYACLPLLLPIVCARGLRSAVRLLVMIAAASVALRVLVMATLGRPGVAFLIPFTRLDGVMLGVAVALLIEGGRRCAQGLLPLAAVCVAAALLLFAPQWYAVPRLSLFLLMPLATVCAFVVVWAVVSSGPASPLNRALAFPVLRYLGDRSYSIYLWHYFIGVAIIAGGEGWRGGRVFLWQLAASLVVAVAAYEGIERPARALLKRRIDGRSSWMLTGAALPSGRAN